MAGSMDFQRNIGLLSPETADKWIDLVFNQNALLQLVTRVPMSTAKLEYPIPEFSRYHTRPAARTTAVTLVTPSEITISLDAKELVLPLTIPDSYAEDSGGDPEKFAAQIATAFGNDLAYLVVNGNTATSVPETITTEEDRRKRLIDTLDGLVTSLSAYNSASQAVNTSAQTTVSGRVKTLFAAIPDRLEDPGMRVLVPPSDHMTLWDEYTATKTFVKEAGGKLYVKGIECIQVAGLPRIVVANPKHLLVGICRDIFMETQRYPEVRGFKVVVSARIDVEGVWKSMAIEAASG